MWAHFGFIEKIRWEKGKYARIRELREVETADLLLVAASSFLDHSLSILLLYMYPSPLLRKLGTRSRGQPLPRQLPERCLHLSKIPKSLAKIGVAPPEGIISILVNRNRGWRPSLERCHELTGAIPDARSVVGAGDEEFILTYALFCSFKGQLSDGQPWPSPACTRPLSWSPYILLQLKALRYPVRSPILPKFGHEVPPGKNPRPPRCIYFGVAVQSTQATSDEAPTSKSFP